MNRIRELYTSKEGASAVEFALVLPFLLLIIFGIVEISWLVSTQTVLNHATFQAARSASKARSLGYTKSTAKVLATNRSINTFWMGTLEPGDVDIVFDEDGDVYQAIVKTTITYESLTGWFEDGMLPAELKSKAAAPY